MLAHGRGIETDLFGGWSFDPPILAGLALLALTYALGVRVARPAARPAPWKRLSFAAAIAVAFVAFSSPTARLADDLFLMHMAQHTLLTNIAVPLALLGAPLLPLLAAIPRPLRRAVIRPLIAARPLAWLGHVLTSPLVAAALYVLTTLAWHFPAAYLAAVESESLHALQHATFIATATLFWAQIIDPLPFRAQLLLPLRMLYLFAAGLPHHLLTSFVLILSDRPLYARYASTSPQFGLSPLSDQRLAGGVMAGGWFVVSLAAFSLLFFIWLGREEREQRLREARGA